MYIYSKQLIIEYYPQNEYAHYSINTLIVLSIGNVYEIWKQIVFLYPRGYYFNYVHLLQINQEALQ